MPRAGFVLRVNGEIPRKIPFFLYAIEAERWAVLKMYETLQLSMG
jgi:hypothetical protein